LLSVRRGAGPLAWVATGSMVQTALHVAHHWPESAVWSAPFVKPLDVEQVADLCSRHQAIIVLEEHSIHGGLGSAVAEIAAAHSPTWICRVGISDRFSQFCGSYDYLMEEHGLTPAAIRSQVQDFLNRFADHQSRYRSAA